MHDQPKQSTAELDPVVVAECKKKEDAIGEMYNAVLSNRQVKEYSNKTLMETGNILRSVPENYTFYNYRREILLHLWEPSVQDHSTESQVNMLLQELELNSALLKKNYKVYAAFVHRRWILEQLALLAKGEMNTINNNSIDKANSTYENEDKKEQMVSSAFTTWQSVIAKELAQCELLLCADERNFHVWNYRRWVLEQKLNLLSQMHNEYIKSETNKTCLFTPDELLSQQFTLEKITHNFSNYSAWHQRALLLQNVLTRLRQHEIDPLSEATTLSLLEEEEQEEQEEQYELLQRHKDDEYVKHMKLIIAHLQKDAQLLVNAMYCDPNDQAAWFYAPFMHNAKAIIVQELEKKIINRETYHHVGVNNGEIKEEPQLQLLLSLIQEAEEVWDMIIQKAARVHVAQDDFDDEKCFLPAYFILSSLVNILNVTNNNNNEIDATHIEKAICRYATLLKTELHDVMHSHENDSHDDYMESEEICKSKNSNVITLQNTVEYLYAHLMRSDGMRSGLYIALRSKLNSILKKAS